MHGKDVLTPANRAGVGYVEAGDVGFHTGSLLDDLKARLGVSNSELDLVKAYLAKPDKAGMAKVMSAMLGNSFPGDRSKLPTQLMAGGGGKAPWWPQWNQLLFVCWTDAIYSRTQADAALRELWQAAVEARLAADKAAGKPQFLDDTSINMVGLTLEWHQS
jgi:hypothetical protein